MIKFICRRAAMVKLVNTQVSKTCEPQKLLSVRVRLAAQIFGGVWVRLPYQIRSMSRIRIVSKGEC